jgi:hypothetical protein
MATVRISKSLIEDAKRKIHEMRHVEHKKIVGSGSILSTTHVQVNEIPDGFDRVRFQDHAKIAQELPKSWFWTERRFYVNYVPTPEELELVEELCPDEINREHEGFVYVTLTIVLPEDVTHSLAACTRHSDSPRQFLPTGSLPGYIEALRRVKDGRAVDKHWSAVIDEVVGFLSSQSTLNAALKALPAIRAYIPEDVLDRVDQVVERRKPEQTEAEPVFNTELIAATAVRLRMGATN